MLFTGSEDYIEEGISCWGGFYMYKASIFDTMVLKIPQCNLSWPDRWEYPSYFCVRQFFNTVDYLSPLHPMSKTLYLYDCTDVKLIDL